MSRDADEDVDRNLVDDNINVSDDDESESESNRASSKSKSMSMSMSTSTSMSVSVSMMMLSMEAIVLEAVSILTHYQKYYESLQVSTAEDQQVSEIKDFTRDSQNIIDSKTFYAVAVLNAFVADRCDNSLLSRINMKSLLLPLLSLSTPLSLLVFATSIMVNMEDFASTLDDSELDTLHSALLSLLEASYRQDVHNNSRYELRVNCHRMFANVLEQVLPPPEYIEYDRFTSLLILDIHNVHDVDMKKQSLRLYDVLKKDDDNLISGEYYENLCDIFIDIVKILSSKKCKEVLTLSAVTTCVQAITPLLSSAFSHKLPSAPDSELTPRSCLLDVVHLRASDIFSFLSEFTLHNIDSRLELVCNLGGFDAAISAVNLALSHDDDHSEDASSPANCDRWHDVETTTAALEMISNYANLRQKLCFEHGAVNVLPKLIRHNKISLSNFAFDFLANLAKNRATILDRLLKVPRLLPRLLLKIDFADLYLPVIKSSLEPFMIDEITFVILDYTFGCGVAALRDELNCCDTKRMINDERWRDSDEHADEGVSSLSRTQSYLKSHYSDVLVDHDWRRIYHTLMRVSRSSASAAHAIHKSSCLVTMLARGLKLALLVHDDNHADDDDSEDTESTFWKLNDKFIDHIMHTLRSVVMMGEAEKNEKLRLIALKRCSKTNLRCKNKRIKHSDTDDRDDGINEKEMNPLDSSTVDDDEICETQEVEVEVEVEDKMSCHNQQIMELINFADEQFIYEIRNFNNHKHEEVVLGASCSPIAIEVSSLSSSSSSSSSTVSSSSSSTSCGDVSSNSCSYSCATFYHSILERNPESALELKQLINCAESRK